MKITYNNNNVYLNVTVWLASPGDIKFSKSEQMSKEELNIFLKIFTRLRGRKMVPQLWKVHQWNPSEGHQWSFPSLDAAYYLRPGKYSIRAFEQDLRKTGNIAGVVHVKPISNEQMKKRCDSGELGKAESKSPSTKEDDLILPLSLFGWRGREINIS